MDPVTHVLSAALWTEPHLAAADVGGRPPRWRARAAVALGALLPDVDGVIGWVSLSLYAKYHRVVTHSVVALPLVIALAALWLVVAATYVALRAHLFGAPFA